MGKKVAEMMVENKWIAYFRNSWKQGCYFLLAIACLGVMGEQLYHRYQNSSARDFLALRRTFDRFSQANTLTQEALDVTEKVIKKHPHLHPGYDTLLAQSYFAQHQAAHASFFIQNAHQRSTRLVCSPAAAFAHTTTLIASGAYEAAYQEALSLESILRLDGHFPRLEACNLLRLLFLAKQLDRPTERAQWSTRLEGHAFYPELAPLFQQQQLTLSQYLHSL